jgi:hypothetical protein
MKSGESAKAEHGFQNWFSRVAGHYFKTKLYRAFNACVPATSHPRRRELRRLYFMGELFSVPLVKPLAAAHRNSKTKSWHCPATKTSLVGNILWFVKTSRLDIRAAFRVVVSLMIQDSLLLQM